MESVIEQIPSSVVTVTDQPVVGRGNILVLRCKASGQALLQEVAPRVIDKA